MKLEVLNIEDLSLVYDLYNNEDIYETGILGYIYPLSLLVMKGKLETWLTDKTQKHFKIVVDGEEIGLAQIHSIHLLNKVCKLGIMIKPSHWGVGYASKVIPELEEICFKKMGLRRIELDVSSQNERGMALFTGLDYKLEGVRVESLFKNGKFIDTNLYAKVISS